MKKKEIIVDEQQPNPFASPAVAAEAAIPEFDPDNEIREFSFGKSLTKWLLVCLVSAAPSFFFGSILEQEYVVQSLAMVSGILTFVAFYVFIESRESTRRMLMDRSLRISVRIGYITRIVISIVFPVGMFLDIYCGVISMSLTTALLGDGFGPRSGYQGYGEAAMTFLFAWFYLTTLVQGIALNSVLAAYTLIVYAIALLFRSQKS